MPPSTVRLLGDSAGAAAPEEMRRIGPAAGHTPHHDVQSCWKAIFLLICALHTSKPPCSGEDVMQPQIQEGICRAARRQRLHAAAWRSELTALARCAVRQGSRIPPPRGRRGLSRECTLGHSKGVKQSEMAGDAQPLQLSRSVCMLHMEVEPELASLLLPACSSPASVMLSRCMSVAMDCSRMRLLHV